MQKIKLYLDFDGVILDTIKITYKMLEEKNLQTTEEIIAFYKGLDWQHLLKISPIMADSINCISKLIASNRFEIAILTHVVSEHEAEEKKKFIEKNFSNLGFIACPKEIKKSDFVDPTGAILVDDYLKNLVNWETKGGISVKFSDKNKENKDFITISRLDKLLDVSFNDGKRKVKCME